MPELGGSSAVRLEAIARDALALALQGGRGAVEELLAAQTPGAGIFGDELPTPLTWILDLVDGAPSHGIAAVHEGVTVAAAVMDVARADTMSAHLGGGARGATGALRVSGCAEVASATVESASGPLGDAQAWAAVEPAVHALRPCPDEALGICRVARGEVDGCFARGLPLPAYAAAALIAAEAGAVTELPCPENDDLVLATSPGVHDALRRLVELPAR